MVNKGGMLMKMITAIVNGKDANKVSDALTNEGYLFTKMATSGGFLKYKNVTLMIGTDDNKVKDVIEVIRKNCARRKEKVSVIGNMNMPSLTTMTTCRLPTMETEVIQSSHWVEGRL